MQKLLAISAVEMKHYGKDELRAGNELFNYECISQCTNQVEQNP